MNPPYEDAPLMIATGLIGVAFGIAGIRAILADRRERRRGRETAPPAREDREIAVRVSSEREMWEDAVTVRRVRESGNRR